MFKEFYEQNGSNLIFWMRDVMTEEEIEKLPVGRNITELLVHAFTAGNFNAFYEEECLLLTKEFVEPVAHRDIEIDKIDVFYSSVCEACQTLWENMPQRMRNIVYGNI